MRDLPTKALASARCHNGFKVPQGTRSETDGGDRDHQDARVANIGRRDRSRAVKTQQDLTARRILAVGTIGETICQRLMAKSSSKVSPGS